MILISIVWAAKIMCVYIYVSWVMRATVDTCYHCP